jgi:hypothetical protein
MELKFTVRSAGETEVSTTATVKGVEMLVDVPCHEVVLVNDVDHGSLVLRFSGPEYAEAKKFFEGKTEVTLKLS